MAPEPSFAGPGDDEAAQLVAVLRACFGAGFLSADREADLRLVVRGELERWYLRGRASQALDASSGGTP